MWWELDADKAESTGGALVRTVREALGQLEWKENELSYPGSSESSTALLPETRIVWLTCGKSTIICERGCCKIRGLVSTRDGVCESREEGTRVRSLTTHRSIACHPCTHLGANARRV